ncbi:MAG: hypothetical protein GY810_25690 [Aureispira sp.]|nr:hypothetical protein [Aureispira sp.]
MDLLDEDDIVGDSDLTPKAISELKGTHGWIRFVAIVGIIGCCISLLQLFYGLSMVMGSGGRRLGGDLVMGGIILGFFLVCIILWALISLLQYGDKIGKFVKSGNSSDLEAALTKQKTYWMIMGGIVLVSLVFYIMML